MAAIGQENRGWFDNMTGKVVKKHLRVLLCRNCVEYKQERDFYKQKCRDYERQIEELKTNHNGKQFVNTVCNPNTAHNNVSNLEQLRCNEQMDSSNNDNNAQLQEVTNTYLDLGDVHVPLNAPPQPALQYLAGFPRTAFEHGPPPERIDRGNDTNKRRESRKILPPVQVKQESYKDEDQTENLRCCWVIKDLTGPLRTCQRKFPCLNDIMTHVTNDHITEPECSPHCCFWRNCVRGGNPFATKNLLVMHITMVHLRNGWVQCTYEGCNFWVQSRSIAAHLKTHERKRAQSQLQIVIQSCFFQMVLDTSNVGNVPGSSSDNNSVNPSRKKSKDDDSLKHNCNFKSNPDVQRDEAGENDMPVPLAHVKLEWEEPEESPEVEEVEEPADFKTCFWEIYGEPGTAMSCQKVFRSKHDLSEHIRVDHVIGPSTCRYECLWKGCSRRSRPFNSRRFILAHVSRMHVGDQQWRCAFPGCSWSFYYKFDLKRHELTHTGLKYACVFPGCTKGFSRLSAMLVHYRACHPESVIGRCVVASCRKEVLGPDDLATHLWSHENVEIFRCGFPGCDEEYGDQAVLDVHRATHIDCNRMEVEARAQIPESVPVEQVYSEKEDVTETYKEREARFGKHKYGRTQSETTCT